MEQAVQYIKYALNLSTLSKCGSNAKCKIIAQKTSWRKFAIAALVAVFATAVAAREFVRKEFVSRGSIALAVQFVTFYGRAPVSLFSILIVFAHAEALIGFFNNVMAVNEHFAEMKFLGYARRIKVMLLICALKYLALQTPLLAMKIDASAIIYYAVHNLSFAALYLVNLMWMTCVLLLLHAYTILNGVLRTLKYQQCWVVGDYIKTPDVPNINLLRNCSEVQNKLYELSETIVRIFGWPLLLNMPMLFLEIIFNTFTICHMLQGLSQFTLRAIVFDAIYFLSFLEIVLPCILVKEQSDKFINRLNKVDLNVRNDSQLDALVCNLSLQIYHQKVQFTVFGIFPLDGTLVYSIFGAITTYLVILIQFYG